MTSQSVCLLTAGLTLVAGGDSPSAVIDFSSIFSSFVSSSTAVFSISCFFSGLAVLTILRDKKQSYKAEKLFPFQKIHVVQHTWQEWSAGWHLHSESGLHTSTSTLSSSAGKSRDPDLILYTSFYFIVFSLACVCVCVCTHMWVNYVPVCLCTRVF